MLYVEGEAPAVISNVELVNAEGIRLLGAMVAGVDLVDAIGATLSPPSENERGWELFLGIEVPGEGLLIRGGVRVDYEVDGHQLVVCTDASVEVRRQCPCTPRVPDRWASLLAVRDNGRPGV